MRLAEANHTVLSLAHLNILSTSKGHILYLIETLFLVNYKNFKNVSRLEICLAVKCTVNCCCRGPEFGLLQPCQGTQDLEHPMASSGLCKYLHLSIPRQKHNKTSNKSFKNNSKNILRLKEPVSFLEKVTLIPVLLLSTRFLAVSWKCSLLMGKASYRRHLCFIPGISCVRYLFACG